MDTCRNCRFFAPGAVIGQCRRYPSIVNKHHTDWCGEHASAKQREQAMSEAQPAAEPLTASVTPDTPKRRGRPPKQP